MTYKQVCDYAAAKNRNLSAEQFSPYNWVYILFSEGLEGSQTLRSVIIENIYNWIIVYSEHGNPIICSEDDVVFSLKQNN